ncbi:MAG: saccharopine dehydrogenase NADP-binding domain-containing protein, partial [Flavobacteriales bacterium]|nr:saccharopine dehydrogenase NADP-binding domain-containing protein [Flavobacteriales bacterium]
MSKIIVLGGGMVGSAMAIDLSKNHEVLLTDINIEILNSVKQRCSNLTIQELDVTNVNDLTKTIKQHDLVISAVPGFLGFRTLKNIIEAKMNVIAISFFPENSLELN